ncbi:complex I intermediate-associated protein 30-domain-containing protein [Rhodotorula diobovata]|uniref:Complex I intermediate-associated protein 30-domain-containing protein n=1 Tax=Rhodotorula diobovata TaxID=5288 RepID=A0A5C5FWF0_9BASI|nr:complex I intermediate-associated protein 30-domain-containing protein [Rhodotorula diobovata]
MSAWKNYLARSVDHLKARSQQVLRASPDAPTGKVLPLVSLRSQEDLANFALGCDADIGGRSSVHLDLGPEGKGRFWGKLSNDLNPGRRRQGVIERGGYAGFRNKQRTTLFGTQTWDTSLHDFLRLRVRSSGDGMRYFVNIQTEGPVRSDLFQHRLWLPSPPTDSAPHEWTDVLIPFDDFTLTNSGDLSATQLEMLRTGVRTVGISVLGPAEGRYELGVEAIDAVSVEPGELERWREKLPPQKGADGGPL